MYTTENKVKISISNQSNWINFINDNVNNINKFDYLYGNTEIKYRNILGIKLREVKIGVKLIVSHQFLVCNNEDYAIIDIQYLRCCEIKVTVHKLEAWAAHEAFDSNTLSSIKRIVCYYPPKALAYNIRTTRLISAILDPEVYRKYRIDVSGKKVIQNT